MSAMHWFAARRKTKRTARKGAARPRRPLAILPLVLELLEDRRLLSNEQVITVDPSTQSIAPGGSGHIDVIYSTNPPDANLTGLGLRIHYDSSKLQFGSFTNGFDSSDIIGQDTTPQDDTSDFDNNPSTDKYLGTAWVSFTGHFDGTTSPETLLTFNFTTLAGFTSGSTTVDFSASSTPPGWTLDAQSATVTAASTTNNNPTLDAISNPSAILENTTQPQTINLTGIGTGNAGNEALTVTATSDNTALISNPTVNYTSPNTTGSISYTPAANQSGTANITITVSDASGSVSRTFQQTVTAVNQAPTIDTISDVSVAEGAGQQTVNLTGITAGTGDSNQSITVTATSDNPGLVPNPTVNYTSPNGTGSLVFTPVAGQTGTATITVTVQDNGGTANGGVDTTTRTFNVTVLNEAPTLDSINPVNVLENAGQQTVTLTGISSGSAGNEALTVTATSNNTALIPNPTVNYTSPNDTGTISFTPAADVSGTATITVTVSDASGTATQSFAVNVTAVNQAPTIDPISDVSVPENSVQQTVNLSGISGGPGDNQTLTVTATSDNPGLVPNPSVTYSSPHSGGTLTFTPTAGQSGTATITVTVQDNGGTANGGVDTATRTFTVTVTPANPPTLAPLGSLTILENAGPQHIHLNASSNGSNEPLTIIATSSNTALIPNPTVVNDNTTIDSPFIFFTPVANASGTATVTVTVSDSGGSVSRSFTVAVIPVNQAPTIDSISNVSVAENSGQQTVSLTGITVGPGDTNQSLTVTATSDNTALIPSPTVTYNSGDSTGTLSFTPVAGQTGTAHITVTVKDNGGTANGGDTTTRTFTVTVTPANQAPTLDAISPVTILENAGQQTVNLTGISSGNAGNEALTVTATSNNPALVPNPTVNYTRPSSTGSISFTPVANASGTAIITVTVSDASGSVTQSFAVTVTAVNQAPTIDAIGNVALVENSGQQTVNLTGITAGAGENQTITVTATSDNPSLISNPTVTYTSPSSTGTLSFTPVAGQTGTASITVTVQDNGGTANGGVDTTTRTFQVTVGAVTQGEAVARDDHYLLPANSLTLTVAAPGVLANDSFVGIQDPPSSGDAQRLLTAVLVSGPSHGTLTLNADGSFTYTANGTFKGIDSFQYSAHASLGASSPATVTIESHAHSFIRRLYETILDREPGEAEVQGWLQALAAGFTRAEVVAGFLDSPEHFTLEVQAAYHDFLGRAADTGALAYWLPQLEHGASQRELFSVVLSSDEYFRHVGGTNDAYVKGLFHDVLGRSASAADLAAWDAALGSFLSRQQAADAFLGTEEFDRLLVDDPHDLFQPVEGFYQHYLDRDADASGAAHFTAELQAGVPYDAVRAAILTSDEFYNG
jgi:VCBS repeat-containing protein